MCQYWLFSLQTIAYSQNTSKKKSKYSTKTLKMTERK